MAERGDVRQRARARWELERRAGMRDLLRFVPHVTPKYEPPTPLQPLCRAFDRIQQGQQLFVCCEAPPRHGKSDTVFHGVARFLRAFPERLVAYCTYSADFAKDQSRKAREIAARAGVAFGAEQLVTNGWDPSASVRYWQTSAGGGFLAVGRGGAILGRGPHFLIVDDPFKDRDEAEREVVREEVWEQFNGTWFTRREPGASVLVFHQRWNDDDLIARLRRQCEKKGYFGPSWEFITLPAISEAGEPLWPSRYSLDDLALIREQVEEYNWWSQYMQSPRPRGGAVFPDWQVYEELLLTGRSIAIGVDVAATTKTESDYSVAVVGAFRRQPSTKPDEPSRTQLDLVEVHRWKVETPELVQNLLELQATYPTAPLVIETSGVGVTVAQHLRQLDPRLRLVEVRPSTDKFLRAQPLVGAIRRGDARVPQQGAWLQDFLHEFRRFDARGGHRHDDQVDAAVHLWNYVQTAGVDVPEVKQERVRSMASTGGF